MPGVSKMTAAVGLTVGVELTAAQAARQAARLAGVRPELAAAYGVALRRWLAEPKLQALGRPFVSEGHRSAAEQDALYAQGRTEPGTVVTYKRGGESKHNAWPSRALDVAFLGADGAVSWAPALLARFAGLMKGADTRVRWGGDWPGFRDRPHFEV